MKLPNLQSDKDFKEIKSWDYNLDYSSTYDLLYNEINVLKKDFSEGNITVNRIKKFSYLVIGLVQLRNGARIGEIIEAVRLFCDGKASKERKKLFVSVLVEKRKDPYYRKVVLPDEIIQENLEFITKTVNSKDKKALVSCISHFYKENYGFSTHALRYAWISHMAILNTPPSVIAKITGHKTLNLILHYTQKKLADKALFEL